MEEILKRVWDNLTARASGPMNFRHIIQPAVASFLAILAGLKDAREGRPTFLWTAVTRAHRPELFRQGRNDVGKVFVLAVLLDATYQLIVQRGVYVLLELLIVATSLAVVPYILYILQRGPVSRIAKWLRRRR